MTLRFSTSRSYLSLVFLGGLLASLFFFATPVLAKQGVIDLQSWDSQRPMALEGPWGFYWQKLLDEGSPEELPDLYIRAGEPWGGKILGNGEQLPFFGYATYRLVLRGLPANPSGYQIFFPYIGIASRILVVKDGTQQIYASSRSGELGMTKALEQASTRPQTLLLGPELSGDIIIIVQVSNFTMKRGGLVRKPMLGVGEAAHQVERLQGVQELIALGVNLSITIYLFMIWLRNRRALASLCLSLTSLTAVARSLSTLSWLLAIVPESWTIPLIRIEHSTVILGVSFALHFFRLSFPPGPVLARFIWIYSALAAGLGVLPFFTSPWFFTSLLPVFQLSTLGAYCLFAALILPGCWRGNVGAWLSLLALLVTFCGVGYDIYIVLLDRPDGLMIFPATFACFLIMQAQVIARRAADAYRNSEQLGKELAERDRSRTQFFHNISHELRTPLNGIIGFLDLVRSGQSGGISEEARRQVDKALKLAEMLKLQVNTILDLAKAKRGEIHIKIQRISLKELQQELDQLAEGLALRSPNVYYRSEIQASEDLVWTDREKLFTILRNLIGNAIKFTDRERDNVVELLIRTNTTHLLLEVKDSGIGIAPEHHKHIFEEFGQVQGDARRRYEGTGLGLTMVHNLAVALGGTIELESALGRGSRFLVSIPLQASGSLEQKEWLADDEDEVNTSFGHENTYVRELTKELNQAVPQVDWDILIVDDNPTNCEVIEGILKSEGYSLRSALSGADALRMMQEKKPNLLLLDMMMPEMSGEDVIQHLRSSSDLSDIPIILITARASDEDRLKGLRLGADDYLAKPIFAAELRLRVRNMAERHKLLKELERLTQDDKLVQLGQMFGDLSHELKNILHGSAGIQRLEDIDGQMAAAALSLEAEHQELMAKTFLATLSDQGIKERGDILQLPRELEQSAIHRNLSFYLAELQLDLEELKVIWRELCQANAEELLYTQTQLKLFNQHKVLQSTLERCRELSLSVLSLTRAGQGKLEASLTDAWQQVQSIIRNRVKNLDIEWKNEIGPEKVACTQGIVMQALLNVVLNAVDALADKAKEEQWITLCTRIDGQYVYLSISNGGPQIPETIRTKLFQRGFSTKGDKGTGIGLFVSRRLLQSAGGDLRCVGEGPHPCFEICLPLALEAQKS